VLKIMNRKFIGILVFFLVLVSTLSTNPVYSAQSRMQLLNTRLAASPSTERVLVRNSDHLAMLKPAGDRVILTLEALSDAIDNLGGNFPKTDFVTVRVDVNQNGRVDPNVDVAFGIQGGTRDKLCTQYMLSGTSFTGCGGFRSGATLAAAFKKTANSATPHPVWEFSIPAREIGSDGNYAHLTISFHQAGKGYTHYPSAAGVSTSFAKVYKVSLKPSSAALASRIKPDLRLPTRIGTAAQNLVQNKDHLVAVRRAGDTVTFVMEALGSNRNYLKGKFPELDFTSIRVDANQNGKVDADVDVAYGIRGGSYNELCAQFLLRESASKGCGSFPSKAQLRVDFRATPNSSRPHPVWEYSIPRSEIGRGNGLSHLTFIFHEAGKGYTRYPQTTAGMYSFTDALVMNTQTLQAVATEAEEPEAQQEEPEIVTHDTKPPRLALTNPPDAADKGEIAYSESDIEVRGSASDESGIYKIRVNNEEAEVSADGSFRRNIRLAYGSNNIQILATDLKDNTAEMNFVILRASGDDSDAGRGVGPAEQPQETLASIGINYALIIGIQTYDDPAITDLDEPVADAEQLKDVLTKNYAFDSSNVKLLKNPDKATLFRELEDFAQKVKPEDSLLIFYAGHGMWDQQFEQGYWLPKDANRDSRVQWISNSDIRDYIRAIHSRHTLLISDACFSGGIFTSRGGFSESDKAIQELYSMPSRKAMTSGTLTEVPDHSTFLDYLTQRLQDNKQEYMSADQLFYRFREAVINNSPNTPQYGVIHEAGDEGGEYIFIRRAAGGSH
jgi:hypothetical protein